MFEEGKYFFAEEKKWRRTRGKYLENEKIYFEEKEKEENIWRGKKMSRKINKWERKEGKYLKKENRLLGEEGGKH